MPNQTPFITIIILNWKGRKLIEQNLPSVLDQSYPYYQVLIVDNNSQDGVEESLKQFASTKIPLRFLQTGANLGYAGGNNKGIQAVLDEGKSDYIVVLNNDVRVDKHWLYKLILGFDQENIGITTSKILLYYPYIQVSLSTQTSSTIKSINIGNLNYYPLDFGSDFNGRGKLLNFPITLVKNKIYNFAIPYSTINPLTMIFDGGPVNLVVKGMNYSFEKSASAQIPIEGRYILQNAGSDFDPNILMFKDRHIFEFDKPMTSEIVNAGCGAAMAIRTDLLKKFGMFRDKYFMYFEDSEFSFKLAKQGFFTKYVNNAICYHYFWGSSGGKETATQIYYGRRNWLWFIRRHFGFGRFMYYYLRTLARTIVEGVDMIMGGKDAKLYFTNYSKVLWDVLKDD